MLARFFLILALAVVIPGGAAMAVDEPAYQASLQEGAFEVRDYPSMVVAEITLGGERSSAANGGFRALFSYITGSNRRRQSITMTAPVVQAPSVAEGEKIAMTVPVTQTEATGGWTVRFVMPGGSTLDSLPIPDDERVHLLALPASRIAVVRFSGLAREQQVDEETGGLKAYIAAHQLHPLGPPSLARYNPPWTLWFLRRNEVWIPVEGEAKSSSFPAQ
jgi:hypothetical protein